MTSYTFGLSADWWLLIVCVVFSLGLALYSYKITVPPIPNLRKGILIFLRTLALSLLFFILFEPVLNIISAAKETPKIAFLFDNSQSMAIRDASVERKPEYINVLKTLNSSGIGSDGFHYQFDMNPTFIPIFSPDSLKLDGQLTNISKAFQTVFTDAERNNVRAVVLVSDGSFNAGENPLYQAELLGRPVYTVGIGDSTEPKDISVQSLITNEIAYVASPLPVNVNLKSSGFDGVQAKVVLRDNDAVVEEQTLNLREGTQNYTLVFSYTPKEEGLRKISATVSSTEGELTQKNNSVGEFVKVLKNKRKVALFAGAPSADVSFISALLAQDKNIQTVAYIQKKNAEFYDIPTPEQLNDAESLVLVGFPIASTPQQIIDLVKTQAERGKPLLFIAGRQTDYTKLRTLEPFLPFVTASSSPQEMTVFADVKAQALSNPVMKINGNDQDAMLWNQLPPIFRTETFVKVKPESEVLATIKINNAPLNEPLILSRSLQNTKSLAILGYELERWKLLGYAAELSKGRTGVADILTGFFMNSLKWLTTQEQGKLVRIKSSKQVYANGEKVELVGQVYDASYNPLDNAEMRVKISGGSEPREIVLTPLGGGRYSVTVEGLAEGDYAFSGSAVVGGKIHGSDAGRFTVGKLTLEFQNPRMNAELLRTLAERTGGKFYTAATVGNLMNDVKNAQTFSSRPVTRRSEYALWNLWYMLAGAISMFAVEWFIRKRSGMI